MYVCECVLFLQEEAFELTGLALQAAGSYFLSP